MNNFDSSIWEENIYGQGNHLNKYPFDNVITFIFRNYPRDKKRSDIKILEVGSGAGNNLWFLAREGFQVTGIDGSPSAIEFSKKRFEEDGLKGNFIVGDFAQLPFDNNSFDIVIDRCSIVCCNLSAGRKAVKEAQRVLLEGGKFFFNNYSQAHTSFASGKLLEDGHVSDILEGTLVGAGKICFYSHKDILDTFANGWEIQSIRHKEHREVNLPQQTTHAEWEVIARKV